MGKAVDEGKGAFSYQFACTADVYDKHFNGWKSKIYLLVQVFTSQRMDQNSSFVCVV